MFRLLRCLFWLSVVYAGILVPHMAWREAPTDVLRAGAAAVGDARRQAVSTAVAYCQSRMAECFSGGTALTALISANPLRATGIPIVDQDEAAPMPIPRPHDLASGLLTRRP